MASDDRRRTLNDNRRLLFAASPLIAFVCECADPDCYATVPLAADRFDLLRQAPPHLLLAPGHAADVALGRVAVEEHNALPGREAQPPTDESPPA
jgi:hypothetical protein